MKNIIYDTSFNLNEWFVIGMIVVGIAMILILPKMFPLPAVFLNLMFGVTMALMFDHTIAVPPFDFYDVGDESNYDYFDIFSYLMYAPFGYLFIYFFLRFKVKGFKIILYLIVWTILGLTIEWIAKEVGVFHYKNGYKLIYSISIYLNVQSLHLYLYLHLFKEKNQNVPRVY